MIALLVTSALADIPTNILRECVDERQWAACEVAAGERSSSDWSYLQVLLRREVATAMQSAHLGDGEFSTSTLENACTGPLPTDLACLARHALLEEEDPSVGIDSEWTRRACELGDRGSCLAQALDHPDQLADHCVHGAANACAWHAEKARLGESTDVARAAGWAQRACMELHEPVACAAAGKLLHDHGATDSANRAHERACTLGYTPSCDPDPSRALADEAPPRVLGPSFLEPGTLEPLPGRPALPE